MWHMRCHQWEVTANKVHQESKGNKMSKLKTLTIPSHHKVNAQAVLNEAIDEAPDTAIVLCFWYDKGQFTIKTSSTPDRLALIGMLEEAKAKVISDGYAA
jgi:hypothetical protein